MPPVISAVDSDPAYNEATISWTTDKPSDSLVRFGESSGDDSLLTRTAYSADLTTEHEIQISGLQPDRDYYFLPVSQDEAGNAVTARLAGRSFRLRTLAGLPGEGAFGMGHLRRHGLRRRDRRELAQYHLAVWHTVQPIRNRTP